MLLYLDPKRTISHQLRMVVVLKSLSVEYVEVNPNDLPPLFEEISPNGYLPILVNQSVGIYDEFVIMQYFDERFPHPSIMSNDPLTRAIKRRIMLEIKDQWYPHLEVLEKHNGGPKKIKLAQQAIKLKLLEMQELVSGDYFIDDELDILDIVTCSIIWRHKKYKIDLDADFQKLMKYAQKIFKQPFFRKSLIISDLQSVSEYKDYHSILESQAYFDKLVDNIFGG